MLKKTGSVLNRIKVYLQQLITAGKLKKEQWKGCDNMEAFSTSSWMVSPRKQIIQVRWMPPDANWIKLNTAGFWRDTEAGAGGVIRDKEGNIIRWTMVKITATSALDAELQALVIGLDAAREHGTRIWIEMDNKEVVTLLNAKRFGAAALRHRVTAIRNRIKQVEVRITHIRSQGNRVAEFLARHGSLEREGSMFNQGSAPATAKALARMDQLGMPSFCLQEQSYH